MLKRAPAPALVRVHCCSRRCCWLSPACSLARRCAARYGFSGGCCPLTKSARQRVSGSACRIACLPLLLVPPAGMQFACFHADMPARWRGQDTRCVAMQNQTGKQFPLTTRLGRCYCLSSLLCLSPQDASGSVDARVHANLADGIMWRRHLRCCPAPEGADPAVPRAATHQHAAAAPS